MCEVFQIGGDDRRVVVAPARPGIHVTTAVAELAVYDRERFAHEQTVASISTIVNIPLQARQSRRLRAQFLSNKRGAGSQAANASRVAAKPRNVEGMQRGSAAAPFDGGSIATPIPTLDDWVRSRKKFPRETAHIMLLSSRKATIRKKLRPCSTPETKRPRPDAAVHQ